MKESRPASELLCRWQGAALVRLRQGRKMKTKLFLRRGVAKDAKVPSVMTRGYLHLFHPTSSPPILRCHARFLGFFELVL